jgi:hypothetical protein
MSIDITGYESVTVADTAIGITAALLLPSTGHKQTNAWITVEGAPIRFRIDGTDPTAVEGHLVDTGEQIEVTGYRNLQRFRAIRTAAFATVIRVTVGRE